MSVTVATIEPKGRKDVTHESADKVSVEDGHLIVQKRVDRGARTVAIYAPSRWADAVVAD